MWIASANTTSSEWKLQLNNLGLEGLIKSFNLLDNIFSLFEVEKMRYQFQFQTNEKYSN